MFDWATWSIEIIGLIILVIWTILPIQEFRLIARRLQQRLEPGSDAGGEERR